MTTRNLVPRGDSQGKLGISSARWEEVNAVNLKIDNLQNASGSDLLVKGPGINDITDENGQLKIALDSTFLTGSLGFNADGTKPVFTSTSVIGENNSIVAAINALDEAAGLVAAPQNIAFTQLADAAVISASDSVNVNDGSALEAAKTTDNALVTGKAVVDWVLSKDYSTTAGTITSVTHADDKGLTASTDNGAVTITTNGILEDLHTLGPAASDSQFIVATGAGAFQYEKDNVARTSLGLGTGNSPTFTDLTLTGNLIVQGTTTTINTSQLTVEDKAIRLGIPSGMTQQGDATYVLSSNEVTVTSANHGLNNGEYVLISDPAGSIPEKVYQITSVADANTFTFAHTAADVGVATAIQHSIANVTDSTANGSGLFVSHANTDETSFKWDSTVGWKISGDNLDLPASKSLSFAGTDILADNAGLMTLSNIDALDATTEATIESAIDTLSNLTSVGIIGTGEWNAGAVTSSGRIMSDDVTEATSTTDGSIQTDGGLSVVKSAVIGKDLSLPSNAAVINIGTDGEGPVTNQVFTITHIDTTGNGGNNPDNAVLVSSGHKLAFGTVDEYITGDGTDLKLISSGNVAITGGLSSTKATTLASAQGITTIGSTTGATISAAGILNINNVTDATTTADGSIQTLGGLSVTKSAVIGVDLSVGDNLSLTSDDAILSLGDGSDVTLTHSGTGGTLASAGAFNIDVENTLGIDSTHTLTVGAKSISITADGGAEAGPIAIDTNDTTGGIKIGVSSTAGTPITIGHATSLVTIGDNLTVTGDLTVNGTTTTVNSTVVTIDDPVFTLGGDAAPGSNDSKDRGIEFRYFDTEARIGFMGYDQDLHGANNGGFVLLKAATNTAEEFSGTAAPLTMGALASTTITASGIIKTTNVDDATTTATGSIQTLGGLGVAKNVVIGESIHLSKDGTSISIGADNDATLTHVGVSGLTIAATPISIDSTGELHLNSTTGDIKLQSAGVDQIAFDLDGTNGEVIIKPMVVGDDLVFKTQADLEVLRFEADGSIDIAGGSGDATVDSVGGITITKTGQLTTDGRIIVDNNAEATNTTDGSIQTDGGLSVALDIFAGNDVKITNDIKLITDGSTINFGADDDVKLTHVPDSGLVLEVNPSSSSVPVFEIKNTSDNGTSAELKFNNTEAAGAGADGDDLGRITFYGQDDNSSNIKFAEILAEVADASNGDECGKISLLVAENDGNNTAGLILTGSTTDGEVDVTIGAGSGSLTTVEGNLVVNNVGVTSRVGSAAKNLSVSNDEVFVKDLPFRVKAANGDTKAEISEAGVGQLVSLSLTGQSAALGMNSQKITSLGTPTADADAATKAYVDSVASGLDIYDSVKAATTASFTMASTASTTTLVLANGEGGFNSAADTFTIDNVSLSQDERVLIKDGVNSNGSGVHNKWNGIYTVGALDGLTLTLTRATDMDVDSEINSGAFFFVEQGNTNADGGFVLTTDGAVTIGTTAIEFSQFSGAGQTTAGDGLSKAGNTLSVNVDDSTIEINSDSLRVKNQGITNAHINDAAAISVDKLSSKRTQLTQGSGLTSSGSTLNLDLGGAAQTISVSLNTLSAINETAGVGDIDVANDSIAIIDKTSTDDPVQAANLTKKATIEDLVSKMVAGNNGLSASAGVISVSLDSDADAGLELNGNSIRIASGLAGAGLTGGSGDKLSLDLNGLTEAVAAVASDSIVFIDSDGSASRKETIADFIDLVSDKVNATPTNGLTSASGVLSLDLNRLAVGAVNVATDSIAIIDSDDNSSSKKESIGDLITAVAGSGLGATDGVLSVTVDDSTLEIDTDTVRVKDDGITLAKLAPFTENTMVVVGAQASSTTPVEITVLDEDNMASDSATALVTQKSVKAFVSQQATRFGGIFSTSTKIDANKDANDKYDVEMDSNPIIRGKIGPFAYDLGSFNNSFPFESDIIFYGETVTAASDRHFKVNDNGDLEFEAASLTTP